MFSMSGKSKRQFSLNRVVMFLSLADIFSWGPYMIISALSGLYLSNKIGADAVQSIAIGTSIYYVTRAIIQMPLGKIADKMKSDKDEILFLLLGAILMGFPFIVYPFISSAIHYYILQFMFGVGVSFNLTNWRKLFALNIDKDREGTQYGFYEICMSGSAAIFSALVGSLGYLSTQYLDIVIVSGGIIMLLASFWILGVYRTGERKSMKR